MSKAEEKSLKAYPEDIEEFVDINGMKSVVDNNSWQRTIFLKGYNQAEKDLELGWEDIKTIYLLFEDVRNEWCGHEFSDYGICREVLKRLKERREK